jgi:hypothetical protein
VRSVCGALFLTTFSPEFLLYFFSGVFALLFVCSFLSSSWACGWLLGGRVLLMISLFSRHGPMLAIPSDVTVLGVRAITLALLVGCALKLFL